MPNWRDSYGAACSASVACNRSGNEIPGPRSSVGQGVLTDTSTHTHNTHSAHTHTHTHIRTTNPCKQAVNTQKIQANNPSQPNPTQPSIHPSLQPASHPASHPSSNSCLRWQCINVPRISQCACLLGQGVYGSYQWCNSAGSYGIGWQSFWGKFQDGVKGGLPSSFCASCATKELKDYTVDGYDATTVCCACGSGVMAASNVPFSSQECLDPMCMLGKALSRANQVDLLWLQLLYAKPRLPFSRCTLLRSLPAVDHLGMATT